MTERKKDILSIGLMLLIMTLYFSRILFTDMIIRAPDITNEFFWTIKYFKEISFLELFTPTLQANWDILANGGGTEGGGTVSLQLLFYRNLIFWIFPEPVNIAWFILFHLFLGATGTYLLCREIGTGRSAAILAGLIFAIAPENASLINAGHVQKIATISFAPWAFYLFERGLLSRRIIWFLATGFILAIQFFNMHWQIAFYTCLALGVYGICRTILLLIKSNESKTSKIRLICLNLVVLVFFLSTVAISLLPLADWSKTTTRGVHNGSNQGKGGMNIDEAMSWSMPPEEVITFIVPGIFGFSRQEGGYNTADIKAYYWGRMVFTQTTDYIGLLPWLLLPLPLIFRRDQYSMLALAGLVLGILFSMGKYTPFYWFLYEHFPGINHFRVPKMMMFIPVLCLGALAARGVDVLIDETARNHKFFRRYLFGLFAIPATLLLCWMVLRIGKWHFISQFAELLSQPTFYEQGLQLLQKRWDNLTKEIIIASTIAFTYAVALMLFIRRRLPIAILPLVLAGLFLLDTWRVNDKYMILQNIPQQFRSPKTSVMEFLAKDSNQYRLLNMNNSDPMQYVTHNIPVMYTSNPVQLQRWQDYLDAFTLVSAMPDIMNVKYLLVNDDHYLKETPNIGNHYYPIFKDKTTNETLLVNRNVMPKAWFVSSITTISKPEEILKNLQDPNFNPQQSALVETAPPFTEKVTEMSTKPDSGNKISVNNYEPNRIEINADTSKNGLLVLGEKYYKGWRATIDGKPAKIHRVDYILRGVYLTPGKHLVEFYFDPLPFRIGKYLTLVSFTLFGIMLCREWINRKHLQKTNNKYLQF